MNNVAHPGHVCIELGVGLIQLLKWIIEDELELGFVAHRDEKGGVGASKIGLNLLRRFQSHFVANYLALSWADKPP